MDKNEILKKIHDIFQDVFDNDDIIITNDTSSEDIDEWDSLSHIQLIVAIEKCFGIKMTAKEIMSWDNVGEMIDAIQLKLG